MSNAIIPDKEYDVVIIGAGPAGMMANLALTTYGFKVLHVDEREHVTTAGRADGLQPRTLEVLRNIGSVAKTTAPDPKVTGAAPLGGGGPAKKMISQGVRVYEVAFWDPTPEKALARTSRAPSCPDFIDVVDNYTLLLHQGLIEGAFLEETEARRKLLPADKFSPAPAHGGLFRPYLFQTCSVAEKPDEVSHPVSVTIAHADTKQEYTVKAKYLFGNDGAKSLVRRAISGGQVGDGEWQGKIQMEGEATDIIWGVMDAVVKTDFPDIKSKCLIHSRDSGSIMVIPRENNLCRFYVQLQDRDAEGKPTHVARDKATQDICIEVARKIFAPYKLEFGYVDWFSVYQIGQRVASRYTLDERVFLGGDATHTHSPKAGQGMNISMLDMYSLAWRINLVEKGLADRKILLPTYEAERRGVAQDLIKFDSEYSKLFSGRSPKSDQLTADVEKAKSLGAVDAQKFIETFKKNAFFTSGCGAVYKENVLNALPESQVVSSFGKEGVFNPKGSKLIAGQRLLPGKVTRAVDANQVRIQQEVKMNGAFRIHVFGGDYQKSKAALVAFDKYLSSPKSFYNLYKSKSPSSTVDGGTAASQYIESAPSQPRNPFFNFLTIFATPHTEWEIEDLPYHLRAQRDYVYSDDVFDRRVPEAGNNAPLHTKYGLKEEGGIVVVRPDGYVAAVVSLNEAGFDALDHYFSGFLVPAVNGKL